MINIFIFIVGPALLHKETEGTSHTVQLSYGGDQTT